MGPFDIDRRRRGFINLCHRFALENHEALAFIGGWSSYPIGMALLAFLGYK